MKQVLAICGSTRRQSANLRLINAVAELASRQFQVTVLQGLDEIPHFNPDLEPGHTPAAVSSFRRQLREADGILICTPEYAMGVPGTLKNAIDWTVASMEFSGKPVALITASSMGRKGHASLLETLKVIESKMLPETQLLISFVKTKIGEHGKIADASTSRDVVKLIDALEVLMNEPPEDGEQDDNTE